MSSVPEYKRFENSVVQRVKGFVRFILGGMVSFGRGIVKVIIRRYTIVLVPHSEKRVYNFHVSVLSMICGVLILGGIVTAFFLFGLSSSGTRGALADRDSRLKDAQASLDQLRNEVAQLIKTARGFEAALSGTLSVVGSDGHAAETSAASASGDLSSFDVRESPEGVIPEVEEIRRLAGYLSQAVEPVKEIGTHLDSQSALLTELPSIWPIKGGIGHISFLFGQTENPFTGQLYIHKGVDLSTYRQGDPVVATADGQVVMVNYEGGGFGNYIVIRHKHGFYTRYAHLLSSRVKNGQKVQQGEVIGYIGNTGLSTGPHLHYEVHIGSDVVDPYKFLNIRSSPVRTPR